MANESFVVSRPPASWPLDTPYTPDAFAAAMNYVITDTLRQSVVALTSAQILALNSTPVTLIAAPGASKIIIVEDILFEMTRTSTQYANGGALEFRYTDGSGAKVSADIASSVVTGAAGTVYNYVGGVIASFTPVVNAAVVIDNATAAFITGTGTARVFLRYHIRDVS